MPRGRREMLVTLVLLAKEALKVFRDQQENEVSKVYRVKLEPPEHVVRLVQLDLLVPMELMVQLVHKVV